MGVVEQEVSAWRSEKRKHNKVGREKV